MGCEMNVYEFGNPRAQTILIQPVDDHELSFIENEIKAIRNLSEKDFQFIAVKIENWNYDLSPWKSPAVFGKDDFGDGADKTLEEIIKICTQRDRTYIIGGYSLAALFSIWAAYHTDIFTAVAAASPSLWFPGFIDFMENNEIRSGTVYLSLGDKEAKTKNPVMATVADNARKAYELLKAKGVNTTFEWNQGNHFKDVDIRTAKAFAWALNYNYLNRMR